MRVDSCTDFARTGPGTLAGRFLRQTWQPVYRSEDLAPGAAKPIRIMSQDYTLYRGQSGAPYLLDARCAHRGTLLSTGWVEDDCIRCFYHGWRYDGGGQCVEQPAEDASFAAKVRVRSYPVREHLGLVWAFLGEGQQPEFPPIPGFDGDGILEVDVRYVECNYFQCLENSVDEVHVSFVHREGGSHRGVYDIPRLSAEETAYGAKRQARRPGQPVRVSHHFMPNHTRVVVPPMAGLEGAGGWRDVYLSFVPVDDETSVWFLPMHVSVSGDAADAYLRQREKHRARLAEAQPVSAIAADILAGKLAISDVIGHPAMAMIEDRVAQAGQGVIADRDQERLGRSDAVLILWRKLWMRELRKVAESRPLTQWHWSGGIQPTQGF
jgi:5,5'-dehydrodivanillate O-demethylase